MMIEPHSSISVSRQCELVGLPKSSYYHQPIGESKENLRFMRLIDEQYLRTPQFGILQMTRWLIRKGHSINHKRVERLMKKMGLQGAVPGPHTSKPHPQNKIYPYLLKDMELTQANLVWSTDLTYVPMPQGFMYLVAVIDWFSRYVLSWVLSNTMDVSVCIDALLLALQTGEPVIFNTDQGAQFTSESFTHELLSRQILIRMDGRGRTLDNVFVERLWRTVKYEDIYLRDYQTVRTLEQGLTTYFQFYNDERPHSSLDGLTPSEVHWAKY
jgi:putative transposase